MDVEDYNQYSLPEGALEDQAQWLTPGLRGVVAVLQDDEIIAIELPGSVELQIVETAPALRGASATARTKQAKLENGVEVQVPEYLEPGERIRVSTEDGRFLGRAS
jgi:elongation factor P